MDDLGDAVDAAVRNRQAIAVDLLVVVGLVGGLWWLIDAHGFDNWLYYVVLFGAVVVYATLVPFGFDGRDLDGRDADGDGQRGDSDE